LQFLQQISGRIEMNENIKNAVNEAANQHFQKHVDAVRAGFAKIRGRFGDNFETEMAKVAAQDGQGYLPEALQDISRGTGIYLGTVLMSLERLGADVRCADSTYNLRRAISIAAVVEVMEQDADLCLFLNSVISGAAKLRMICTYDRLALEHELWSEILDEATLAELKLAFQHKNATFY